MLSVCRVLLLFVCVFCLLCCDVAAANKTDVQSVVSGVKEKVRQAQQLWQNATDEHKNKVLTGANSVLSLLQNASQAAGSQITQENIDRVIENINKAEKKADETKAAVEKTKTAVEKIKAAVGALADAARTATAAETKEAGKVGGVVTAADTALRLWGNVAARMESQLAAVNNTLESITAAKGKFEKQPQEPSAPAAPPAVPPPASSEVHGKPAAPATHPPQREPAPEQSLEASSEAQPPPTRPSEAGTTRQPGERGELAVASTQVGEPGKTGVATPSPTEKVPAAKSVAAKPLGPEEPLAGDGLGAISKPLSSAKLSLLSPVATPTKFNLLQQTALNSGGDGAASADNDEAEKALQSAIDKATKLKNTVQETNNVMLEAAEASDKAVEAAEKWAAALMSGGGKSTRGGEDAASLLSSSLFSPGSTPGVAFCFALYYLSVCVRGILF